MDAVGSDKGLMYMKAVVFDFDGVIVDTETPELQSYEEMFAQYNIPFPIETWIATVGSNLSFDVYEYLNTAVSEQGTDGPLDVESLRAQRRRRHWELVLEESLCEGVLETLEQARALGLKIALASSSKSDWVLPLLERHNLKSFFEAIVTADLVQRVKPDPELYTRALSEIEVEPHAAVAIEDSVNGLKAAKAAGMECVVVPNPITSRLVWPAELLYLRLQSLKDLSLSDFTAMTISR